MIIECKQLTSLLQDTDDLVTSDTLDLSDTVGIAEDDTDLIEHEQKENNFKWIIILHSNCCRTWEGVRPRLASLTTFSST